MLIDGLVIRDTVWTRKGTWRTKGLVIAGENMELAGLFDAESGMLSCRGGGAQTPG